MPEDCQIALRRRGICVIIPTYNNAGTVADVVKRALAYCQDVYVVLDGCTDDTRARLEQLAVRPVIVEIPRNSGKGNAPTNGAVDVLLVGPYYGSDSSFTVFAHASIRCVPFSFPVSLSTGWFMSTRHRTVFP